MSLLVKTNFIKKIIKLKLYFLAQSSNNLKYSNYFLLGYRENHAIVRPTALNDSLNRLRSFSKLVVKSQVKLWTVGFKPKYFNPTRWVAYKLNANFILFTGRRGVLFYLNKKYFWVSHRFFTYRLLFILGLDLVLFTNLDGSSDFQILLKNLNIPSIGIVNNTQQLKDLTYPILLSANLPSGLIFALRLLTLFLRRS